MKLKDLIKQMRCECHYYTIHTRWVTENGWYVKECACSLCGKEETFFSEFPSWVLTNNLKHDII